MLRSKNKIELFLWLLFFVILTILIFIDPQYIVSMPLLFIGNVNELGRPYTINPDGTRNYSNSDSSGKSQSDREATMIGKLEDVANRNHQLLDNKLAHGKDVYDISDQQSRELAAQQTIDNKQKAAGDWFSQIKKLQGSADQLKSSAGGSMTGSNFYAMMDLLGRADDDIDTETLRTKKENQDTINNDLYEALSASVNGRNELAADSEYAHGQIGTDFLAQVANIAGMGDNAGIYDEKTNSPAVTNGSNVYNENKVGPAQYTDQGLYRQNNDLARAQKMYTPSAPSGSAANQNYWQKMLNGYSKR